MSAWRYRSTWTWRRYLMSKSNRWSKELVQGTNKGQECRGKKTGWPLLELSTRSNRDKTSQKQHYSLQRIMRTAEMCTWNKTSPVYHDREDIFRLNYKAQTRSRETTLTLTLIIRSWRPQTREMLTSEEWPQHPCLHRCVTKLSQEMHHFYKKELINQNRCAQALFPDDRSETNTVHQRDGRPEAAHL